MAPKEWQSEDIQRLASGYWASAALHALVSTGLAQELAAGPATAAELARIRELSPRATGMLLTAGLALELLVKQGEWFSLAPGVTALLSADSPRSMANAVLHLGDLMGDWAKLTRCVKTGQPVERRPAGEANQGQQPERAHFYRAMRDLARNQAPGMAARIGLSPGQRVLDLGGGPGVYGLTFADEVEDLSATVFDLPQSEAHFREESAVHPRGAGVRFLPGDFRKDHLGGPYDVVWLSQVLHGEGPEGCRHLVALAAEALAPGGALWVQEFVLEPDDPKPPWPALFSLNMLVNTENGQSYTAEDIRGFMEAAGLVDTVYAGPTRPGGPAGLVRGVKPLPRT